MTVGNSSSARSSPHERHASIRAFISLLATGIKEDCTPCDPSTEDLPETLSPEEDVRDGVK